MRVSNNSQKSFFYHPDEIHLLTKKHLNLLINRRAWKQKDKDVDASKFKILSINAITKFNRDNLPKETSQTLRLFLLPIHIMALKYTSKSLDKRNNNVIK